MNKLFLFTGKNYNEIKQFTLLVSKICSSSKSKTLIINFNSVFWDFFKSDKDKRELEPQKISLKEYFINVDASLFEDNENNREKLNFHFKMYCEKFSNIIVLINKSNNWIYHLVNQISQIKCFEFSQLQDIQDSIDLDIQNQTQLPFFVITQINFDNNKNEFLKLKKIYLNKIIALNLELNHDIESILFIPRKIYAEKDLKVIKSFLNVI